MNIARPTVCLAFNLDSKGSKYEERTGYIFWQKRQMHRGKLFHSVINAVVEVCPKKCGNGVEKMICSIWQAGECFTMEWPKNRL